jgi:MFS family permease
VSATSRSDLASSDGHRRRDLLLLLATRTIRAFGFGFSAVLLGIYLQALGLNATEIGLIIAASLAAASLSGLLAAAAASRIGRRSTLAAVGLLMALVGIGMGAANPQWLVLAAALTGMLGSAGTDLGPFLAVEQAVLAEAANTAGRNVAFARYSLSGALAAAAGATLAGLGTSVLRDQALYFAYGGLGLVTAAIPLLLSRAVEGEPEELKLGNLRPLIGLSALFAVDSLGGGLVARSVIVYWLHIRYGAGPEVLGPAFGLMSLASASTFELAGRLSNRIGLVNTMVFTHFPSNILLMFLPFLPNLGLALAMLTVWSAMQGMDIPARQAYVVSIVKPAERSAAVAITGSIRGLAQSAGPLIAGVAIQSAALGLPFFLAGGVKALYDIALYHGYRRRFGDHETLDAAVRQAP